MTVIGHYLDRYWFLKSNILRHLPTTNSSAIVHGTNLYNEFENYSFKITTPFLRYQCVKYISGYKMYILRITVRYKTLFQDNMWKCLANVPEHNQLLIWPIISVHLKDNFICYVKKKLVWNNPWDLPGIHIIIQYKENAETFSIKTWFIAWNSIKQR